MKILQLSYLSSFSFHLSVFHPFSFSSIWECVEGGEEKTSCGRKKKNQFCATYCLWSPAGWSLITTTNTTPHICPSTLSCPGLLLFPMAKCHTLRIPSLPPFQLTLVTFLSFWHSFVAWLCTLLFPVEAQIDGYGLPCVYTDFRDFLDVIPCLQSNMLFLPCWF